MLDTVLLIVFAMIGLSLLLNLWRLIIGPSVPDRVLALDTMYINVIALIILYSINIFCTGALLRSSSLGTDFPLLELAR